jgi:hypothetical protein
VLLNAMRVRFVFPPLLSLSTFCKRVAQVWFLVGAFPHSKTIHFPIVSAAEQTPAVANAFHA